MIKPQTCPICGKPVASWQELSAKNAPAADSPGDLSSGGNRHFPFCSQRCQEIDLLRWSKGQYRIVEPISPENLAEELERRGELGDDGAG
ncbi:MAG TPA: hypothetical protein DDY91_23160 [Planctomycetaceae bacterium]|jgi:endogenous inhibitor of DNA gyrase (YacG/DUF329 family)|nr:hypothetical protein [Planctomycetaceae bacterium]